MIQFWRRTSPKAALVAALFFFLTLSQTSCLKHNDEIGFDLLPNSGNFNGIVADSFKITAQTIREDSLRVDSLSRSLFGVINDPDFGLSTANLYFQCLLQEINIDYGLNPKLDSIVLSLVIDKNVAAYGSSEALVEVDFYRMTELLKKENRYYSNYMPSTGSKIGNWKGRLNKNDTTWYFDKGSLKSQTGLVRMKLDKNFGEQFFTAGAYGSNSAFLNFLNGIAIVPRTDNVASGDGRMAPIHLNSTSSKLTIYFNDTLQKDFVISDQSERMMYYELKNRNAAIANQINNPGVHYSETYIQAMGSCKTKIEIPDLLDLVKDGKNILINEAEITFTIKDGTTSTEFPAPSRLLLFQPANADGTGTNALIQDLIDQVAPPVAAWNGFTNYGGNLSSDGKTYTFRFNRHLQRMLDTHLATGENTNRGFYLVVPSDNPITPARVILDTRNDQVIQNIRVKITYTKL